MLQQKQTKADLKCYNPECGRPVAKGKVAYDIEFVEGYINDVGAYHEPGSLEGLSPVATEVAYAAGLGVFHPECIQLGISWRAIQTGKPAVSNGIEYLSVEEIGRMGNEGLLELPQPPEKTEKRLVVLAQTEKRLVVIAHIP